MAAAVPQCPPLVRLAAHVAQSLMNRAIPKFVPPPVFVLMAGSTMWGITWIWLKAIDDMGVGPILISVIAYGVQFLMLLPWVLPAVWPRLRTDSARPLAWRWLLPLALLSGIAGIGFAVAMVYGDVVRSMLLFFLIPAWGVIFGHVFLHEPLTRLRITAVILAIGGAIAILGPDIHWGFSIADLAALTAGLALAASNVVFRYLQAEPMLLKLSIMQLGGVVFGLAALMMCPEPLHTITLPGLVHSVVYGSTLLLGAMLATQYAVERLPAGRSAVLMTLELLVASGTAIWIGHEHPAFTVWMGGGLILAAALLEATSHQPDSDPAHDQAKP
ncbi:MAG: DMT family transporter [Halothiobacillus sp.]